MTDKQLLDQTRIIIAQLETLRTAAYSNSKYDSFIRIGRAMIELKQLEGSLSWHVDGT